MVRERFRCQRNDDPTGLRLNLDATYWRPLGGRPIPIIRPDHCYHVNDRSGTDPSSKRIDHNLYNAILPVNLCHFVKAELDPVSRFASPGAYDGPGNQLPVTPAKAGVQSPMLVFRPRQFQCQCNLRLKHDTVEYQGLNRKTCVRTNGTP
jgi:hypothetical protein